MKNNLEKIIESAKKAKLGSEEKALMRSRLLSVASKTPTPSPFWSFSYFSYRYVPAVLLLIVLIGGGTSILADKSLPGDALYPMKINFNENIQSLLATSPKSIAEISADQATTRVTEAETLVTKGVLTTEQGDQIKNNFSKKVDSMNMELQKLDDEGATTSADEVQEKFQSEIENHLSVMGDASHESSTSPVADVINFIRNKSEEVVKNRRHGGIMMTSMNSFATSTGERGDGRDSNQIEDNNSGEQNN